MLECSGNARNGHFGLLSSAEWHGIPLSRVLERLSIRSEATRVSIAGFDDHSEPSSGNSTPGASWIFSFDELASTGAFLATRMNGEPLPADHGAPVRLFVPGYYGCTCIKWVNEIALVDDSAPATSQMVEFASRTHQDGTPSLARDYQPALMDQAAMPVRVEKWLADGRVSYRIVGISVGRQQADGQASDPLRVGRLGARRRLPRTDHESHLDALVTHLAAHSARKLPDRAPGRRRERAPAPARQRPLLARSADRRGLSPHLQPPPHLGSMFSGWRSRRRDLRKLRHEPRCRAARFDVGAVCPWP